MGSCSSKRQQEKTQTNTKFEPSNRFLNQINEIMTEDQFNEIINNLDNKQILIVCDFYATWCPPCAQIAPVVHDWATNDYKINVIFLKIDVDQANDLSNRFSIHVLPTFILIKDGKELLRLSGTDISTLKREIDQNK